MNNQEAKELLIKYDAGQCTEAEKALIEQWIMQFNEGDIDISPERIEELGEQIYRDLPGPDSGTKKFSLWPIIAIAAVVSMITITTWLYFDSNPPIAKQMQLADITPGGNKALLTLANGNTINLSAAKTGIKITATGVVYDDGAAILGVNNDKKGINTITTPNGGEYQIVLPDGTKVWLNAASTLHYPTTFRERGARQVELRSGEAYFQVAKDSKRPFIVTTRNQDVTVLGTTFNINAYSDQPEIKTTLVEGSVKVAIHPGTSNTLSKIIKPGEQAVFQNDKITVNSVDLSLETAWKNGKIQFQNVELKTVMSMLMRWYDIQVEYAYYPSDVRFSGSIARSKNISEILELIQSTGDVHYKIEGRKVLLMK